MKKVTTRGANAFHKDFTCSLFHGFRFCGIVEEPTCVEEKYSKTSPISLRCKLRIPEEGAWVKAYEIKDISGYTHGIGWCAPQQGTCKLSLNIKNGIIEEALVETIGCSGMTHSAAMAGEILPGKTILEALNTDLVCDAINVAMRELFLQIVYGRSQTAFSDDGLPIGAGLEDLGDGQTVKIPLPDRRAMWRRRSDTPAH